jgi:KaiC/GvpD/RAD55 family RecA-like ATPase
MKQVNADKSKANHFKFPKSQTGIPGLDYMTHGGIPKNRPTLLSGNAGCGKTIMVMFTAAITVGSIEQNPSDEGISSMVDTWIMVQDIEVEVERTRSLCVMKSRGMVHSNEVRKFIISSKGITLMPIVPAEKRSKKDTKRSKKEHQSLSTS